MSTQISVTILISTLFLVLGSVNSRFYFNGILIERLVILMLKAI